MQVLRGIDLEIKRGEIASIVGPSGAGKTTLLQIMGTLDRPDSGTVVVDGVSVAQMREKQLAAFRNRHVGFVFQFHQLLPEFTAVENVMIPALIAGAKYVTNVYCPYQLNIYNGLYPFVRILESYPADFIQPKPGRCFPAGHATAGFAFMALFFCFDTPWKRWLGLAVGLAVGWTAALYQMYRGQHFLSHSVFSMIAAFMVILLINEIVSRLTAAKNDKRLTEK